MGYTKQSPGLIVIVIVVAFLILTPLAYGQLLDNGIVNGRMCCTSNGNCPPGAVGIPGVRAIVNCTNLFGNVVTLGQGVTDPTGAFNLPVSNILGLVNTLLGGLLSFSVSVNLPLNSTVCPVLSTVNGTLVGVPTLVSTIVDPVLGLVGNLSVPVFTNVTIG